MKQLVVKFKSGYVGYAHDLNGEVESTKLTRQTPFGFEKAEGVDPGIYNVFWELNTIMNEAYEYIKKNPTERICIAVPGTVYALANSTDMLTRMVWTRKCLYYTSTDKETKRTTLMHRKTTGKGAQYPLSDEEFVMYRNLLINMKKLVGHALIVDSYFTCSTEENAKTEEQKTWVVLNEAVNEIVGIGANTKTGAPLIRHKGCEMVAGMTFEAEGDVLAF